MTTQKDTSLITSEEYEEITFSLTPPTRVNVPTAEPVHLTITLNNPEDAWKYYDLRCLDVPHVVLQSDRPRIALAPQSTRDVSVTLLYQSDKQKRARHWPPTPFACTLQPLIPLTGEHTGDPHTLSVMLFPESGSRRTMATLTTLCIVTGLLIVSTAGQRAGWWQLQKAIANPIAQATPLDSNKDNPAIPEVLLPFQTVLEEKNYDTLVALCDKILDTDTNNSIARDLKAYAAIRKNATTNREYTYQLLQKTGVSLSDTSSPETRAVHLCAQWAYCHAIGDATQADALKKRAEEMDIAVARTLID
jgi:hypothetical protein